MNSKYVSIDLETTGLNPNNCQVIEIGAVIDDLDEQISFQDLPHFQCYVVHDVYQGEPYALSMHSKILRRISHGSDYNTYLTPFDAGRALEAFLWNAVGDDGKVTVAGKNFSSFDRRFLETLPDWNILKNRIRHRSIDPAMLYWDPLQDGAKLPSTATCLARAGIKEDISHTALADALQVIKLIRSWRNNA